MNSTRGAAISLQAVCKQYLNDGQAFTAVDRVDLDVEPSSFVALTGPSGSGKSTLLHLIGSIDAPDSGSITIDHIDITALTRRQLPDYRRRVGFVFQRYNLLPALTALDNVLVPVLPTRVDFDKTARARELLAAVGLADRERSYPAACPAVSNNASRSPEPYQPPPTAPGRRTHRQPRQPHRHRNRPVAHPDPRRNGHDHPARNPRSLSGSPRRSNRPPT